MLKIRSEFLKPGKDGRMYLVMHTGSGNFYAEVSSMEPKDLVELREEKLDADRKRKAEAEMQADFEAAMKKELALKDKELQDAKNRALGEEISKIEKRVKKSLGMK